MMDSSAISYASFGRGAAYVAYNVPGVSSIVGLVRLVVAAIFLAKLHLDHKYRPQSLQVRRINFEENKVSWQNAAIHGAIEMIPIAGPAFFTYHDNFDKYTQFSTLHLVELKELITKSW